jgi:general secretion pathway protein L
VTTLPFADALTPLLGRIRARYTQSPLPGFLAWWGGALRDCLPERWQERLRVQQAQVWLSWDGEALQVERVDSMRRHVLGRLGDDGAPSDAALVGLLGEAAARLPRILLLPTQDVLLRRLATLRAVVGFEIDRQTPFRQDQVEFDCRLLPAEKGAKLVPVELAVLPRERLDALLARLGDIRLDALDVVHGSQRGGLNLLPQARRRPQDHRPLLINLGLAGAGVLLLLLAMGTLVDNRLAAVAALEADVETQRAAARRTTQLRKTLDEAAAAANFLAEHKAQQPSMIGLLRDLTDILPDDTFLERIAVTGDTLNFTVQSGSAAKLIELFQGSTTFREPTLLGAVQPDSRSGKDRATLTVRAVPQPEARP